MVVFNSGTSLLFDAFFSLDYVSFLVFMCANALNFSRWLNRLRLQGLVYQLHLVRLYVFVVCLGCLLVPLSCLMLEWRPLPRSLLAAPILSTAG